MLLAEIVIFMLAALPHLLLERTIQILEVNSQENPTAAEGVGDSDLFEVVDADEVGNGGDDSLPKTL